MPEEIIRLRPGEEVAVKVRGKAGHLYGPWSDPLAFTADPDTSAPGKPTGLTLTAILKGMVINWSNPTDKDAKYCYVYVSTSSISVDGEGLVTGLAPTAAVDSDYCIIGNLSDETTYYVRVEAVDNAGNRSQASEQQSTAIPSDLEIAGVYKVSGNQVVGSRQGSISDAKTDYTTGDLDTEAEIIAAINSTNGAINSILAALRAHGLIAT